MNTLVGLWATFLFGCMALIFIGGLWADSDKPKNRKNW